MFRHSFRYYRKRFFEYKICDVYPLHFAFITLLIMGIVHRAITLFNTHHAKHPISTTLLLNTSLAALADTTAQTLSAVRRNRGEPPPFEPSSGIELHDSPSSSSSPSKHPATTLNFPEPSLPYSPIRTARFALYGFLMTPIQMAWFCYLARFTLPLRIAMDQLLFAPVGVATFFSAMTVFEGGSLPAIRRKLVDCWWPTVKVNWLVWPVVQGVNFGMVPGQWQVPFVSGVGVLWTGYLSLVNEREEERVHEGEIQLV